MKNLAVAFTGPSNSGKTTLIVKISEILGKNNRVCIIKNDPSDKARFDTEGKDSWKFSQTGAEVIVASPQKTTLLCTTPKSFQQMYAMFDQFDYLLVEGLKEIELPRIAIFKEKIDENFFPYIKAVALHPHLREQKHTIPKELEIFDVNDVEAILDWIDKNSIKVR